MSAKKYKVGDKVCLRKNLAPLVRHGGHYYITKMYFDDIRYIKEKRVAGYNIEGKGTFKYTDEMLCPYTECTTSKDQAKYKVGDRVIMRTDLKDRESYGGIAYLDGMYFPIVTIKTIVPGRDWFYTVEELDRPWLYSSEMFKGLVDEADKKCTKFNVGDKVVLKKGLIVDHFYGGFAFVKEMEFKGVRTIQEIPSDEIFQTSYLLKEDKVGYFYTAEMLEPYKEEATISLTSPDSCSLRAAKDLERYPVTINSLDANNGFYTVTPFYAPVVNELQSVVADIHEACKEMKSHCEGMSWNDTSTMDVDSPVTIKVNKKKSKIHLNFNNNGT